MFSVLCFRLTAWAPTVRGGVMPLTLEPTYMRTSSLRTLPPPDASPSQQQAIVTLAHVRCGPRAINEYVDSPRPLPILPLKSSHIGLTSSLPPSPTPAVQGSGHVVSAPCRTNQRGSSHTNTGQEGGGGSSNLLGCGNGGGSSGVVSTQPSKSPPLKDEGSGGAGSGERGAGAGDSHSSIICTKCGKCRCAACAEPRELPARWCCGERYEVSARRVVDVCSCFCCVQTAFYHCGSEEDNACYDNPCTCGGSKCCSRWTCLAASAVLLPCLWCYWPMRGCLAATTSCYNCCRKKGCQCSRRPADKTATCSQTRRLLIESDSSSAWRRWFDQLLSWIRRESLFVFTCGDNAGWSSRQASLSRCPRHGMGGSCIRGADEEKLNSFLELWICVQAERCKNCCLSESQCVQCVIIYLKSDFELALWRRVGSESFCFVVVQWN